MIPPNDDLLSQIAEAQDQILEHSGTLEYARQRLDRPARQATSRWRVAAPVVATGLALAAMALLAIQVQPSGIEAAVDGQALAVGDWVGAEAVPVQIEFSDGTAVMLEPGAQARVVAMDQHGAKVLLEQGEARFDVEHLTDETSWTVQAGPFEVAVVGTVFSATWNPEERTFAVDMDEGEVRVRGPHVGEDRQVRDTDVLEVWLDEGRSSLNGGTQAAVAFDYPELDDSPDLGAPQHQTQGVAEVPEVEADEPAPEVGEAPWISLAKAGHYSDAVAAARTEGTDAVLEHAALDGLVLLGDTARLGGDPDLARTAYQATRDRHAGSAEAAMAAFNLGRLAFDVDRDLKAASHWMGLALQEQPDGPLAREALGRQMEAERDLGHRSAARELATDYLSRFPDGPHVESARQILPKKGR